MIHAFYGKSSEELDSKQDLAVIVDGDATKVVEASICWPALYASGNLQHLRGHRRLNQCDSHDLIAICIVLIAIQITSHDYPYTLPAVNEMSCSLLQLYAGNVHE